MPPTPTTVISSRRPPCRVRITATMKKSGGAGKKKQPNDAIDEVEKLLSLTQNDFLLKLTINSHTNSRSKFDFIPKSSHNDNAIHPDLDRRFQALRTKPNPNSKAEIKPGDHEDIDNLLARFAALKAPANATSTSSSSIEQHSCVDFEEEEEEEDGVSKIINWAIDAARLDPSPSSDIDDGDDDDDDKDDVDDSDEDSDDDVGRTVSRKKKGSKK